MKSKVVHNCWKKLVIVAVNGCTFVIGLAFAMNDYDVLGIIAFIV